MNKNRTGIKIQGTIYSGTILTHKNPTHISNGKGPAATPSEHHQHLRRYVLEMYSNCVVSSTKVLRQGPSIMWVKPEAIRFFRLPSIPHSILVLCDWPMTLLCGFWLALTNGGPSRDKGQKCDWDIYSLASSPREEACILTQKRMHPSQGSLLDKTQSSQVPVIMPFPGPIGSRGGNSSAMTSTISSLLVSLHLPTPFQFTEPLPGIRVWSFYVGILFFR